MKATHRTPCIATCVCALTGDTVKGEWELSLCAQQAGFMLGSAPFLVTFIVITRDLVVLLSLLGDVTQLLSPSWSPRPWPYTTLERGYDLVTGEQAPEKILRWVG